MTDRRPEDEAHVAARLVSDETVPQGMIELRAERLIVNKQREVAGALTFAREVRTETVQVPVELVTEVLVIEHTRGTQAVMLDGQPLQAGERREVVIYSEEALVDKRVVVSEEVNIAKRTITESRTFETTLAHEELVVQESGDVQRLSEPDLSTQR